VSPLEVGDSLRLGEVSVPHGVKILDDAEEILCSVLRLPSQSKPR